jgi:quinol monooxygenase YgiN
MPVAVHITPEHMSREDYEHMIKDLKASGAGDPKGRVSHTAYGEDNVQMLEIWESRDDFEAHRDRLFAVMQSAGLGGGNVDVHPVHSELPD